MKKILLISALFISLTMFAQVPNQVNYQGVARNSVGNVLPNKKITVRLTIRDGNATGSIEYRETRNITTSNLGSFNIAIGSTGAINVIGSLSSVNWSTGVKFLQVEIDPEGNSNFIDVGTSQLHSVPYALFAANSANSTPTGNAGGDLSGTYPDPNIANGVITSIKIADNAVTTSKILDSSITSVKLAPGIIPTTLPPTGNAGGDLTGNYPDPVIANGVITTDKIADDAVTSIKLSDNSVTTSKLVDGSVTSVKLADGVIPTTLPPTGNAGGDLTGSYPDPLIANGVITTNKIADNAVTSIKLSDNSVTTSKLVDGSVTNVKLAAGVIPTTLPPTGNAGGDLNGTYPNPIVNKIQGIFVNSSLPATGQVLKFTGTEWAPDNDLTGSGNPSGPAGGDLSGTYPNPIIVNGAITTNKIADNAVTSIKLSDNSVTTSKLVDGSVTSIKLAAGIIPTTLPPTGNAGGDLTGAYPDPIIANSAITTNKIADNAVTNIKLSDNSVTTSKLVDGSVTSIKLAAGIIPTTLPPTGNAGGDLFGTYPNPTVNKIQGISISNTSPLNGQVLKFNGTEWVPGNDITGSGNPTGPAGGDLSGTYPNPNIAAMAITTPKIANGAVITPKLADGAVTTQKIADNSITTAKVVDGSITMSKLGPDVVLGSGGPPTGPAGGDLSGTYPNPIIVDGAITTNKIADNAVTSIKLSDNSVTTSKLIDGSVTSIKLAAGIIPTTLPPTGNAGGDLTGTYPNPTITNGAITTIKISDDAITNNKLADNSVTTSKIADNSIITSKVADGSITMVKLGPDVILGSGGPPTGPAGGDLSGTYPNPSIANAAITTIKIADNAVTTSKLSDASITNSKLADNSVGTSKIIDGSVTSVKLAAGLIPTTLPPTGNAGGDLTGTYPNPIITDGVITTTKLADNSVTTSKLVDGSVTSVKLAAGIIPTTLPPTGNAGGDLTGTYPNPIVNKIQGITVSNTSPLNGQVLKFNGTQWVPDVDNSGGITFPYSFVNSNSQNLFSLTNQGTGAALEGINSSTNANVSGIIGKITSATAGSSSSALRGINSSLGFNGYGVWGTHNGFGSGVYGNSISGNGVQGSSTDGSGVFGTSTNSSAGYFDISNASNSSDVLFAYTVGNGSGVTAISEQGNGIWGITYNGTSAGVLGYNIGGGEGVVGRAISNTAGAVVGRNDGTYAGVHGISAADGGTGILAQANVDGTINGNALVASIEGSGDGNPAVFKANGANVARIDKTGKGFFNGGTQVGGADVAEFFDVEGNRDDYEPGDVLVISVTSDRKVEKSSVPYSPLIAGVFATKPGIILTEKNAEQDQLDNMVPMGVIGVIPVKVCLEGGEIKRGDLLVTSSLQGIAMKADPAKIKPGQLLGKALQDFDSESVGKINVLVSIK